MAEDTPVTEGGSLDQGEVDQLLSPSVAAGETPPAAPTPVVNAPDGVVAYDFRNPAFLTEAELRRLRGMHEDFTRHLAARLALFLRMECGLKLKSLSTPTFARFTESLPLAAHLSLFKAEPLPGVCVADVDTCLALALVDRVLGGKGVGPKEGRALTEIETALLEDVVKIVLEEWCSLWKDDRELKPQIIGHESNGRFLQTSPRGTSMLLLTLECTFGETTALLRVALPCYTVEPLIKARQARRERANTPEESTAPAAWRPVYEHIELPLRAEWVLPSFTLREVAALRVGDVIELPLGILDQTRVLLNGVAKFGGTVGLEGDRVAVQINHKIPAADDARAS